MSAQIIDISTPAALIRQRAISAQTEAQFEELKPWFRKMLGRVPEQKERVELAAFIASQMFTRLRNA